MYHHSAYYATQMFQKYVCITRHLIFVLSMMPKIHLAFISTSFLHLAKYPKSFLIVLFMCTLDGFSTWLLNIVCWA